ncbi:hypothetical protein [Flaviaesturariibacter amylovorans]|uniref:hypothetical protein n=1 Tax=Flaviaesturariibacter amylovorans TaxID=1084520 RepID=UPI0031E54C60
MPPEQNKQFRFFIQEHLLSEPVLHGGIGNKDIESILLEHGWSQLRFRDHHNFSAAAKFRRLWQLGHLARTLPRGAEVLLQWPLYARMNRLLLQTLKRFRKDVRFICYVTDINGIKDGNAELLGRELACFRMFDRFIAHNATMRAWLQEHFPEACIATIDFFDFRALPSGSGRAKSMEIVFAGNLFKSGFLQELPRYNTLTFHLFGEASSLLPQARNCVYHGAHEPARLPALLPGSFGLVWDGESSTELKGPLGDYARYISPHKLSLFILAGLPIICHDESAAAALVARYGIGFSVPSLSNIGARIAGMTDVKYAAMRNRMQPLAERISTGRCLLDALADLG